MSDVVSKSAFAKLVEISPARVTQLIKEGKISGEALLGEGRTAKIVVDVALEQLKLRRDVGQALGNGAKTNLNPDKATAEHTASSSQETQPPLTPPPRQPSKADEYAQEQQYLKLQAARRKERQEQEQELLARDYLMKREEAEKATEVILGIVVDALTGHPDRLGDELAAQFQIADKRGLVFFLRSNFRDLRGQINDALARRAEIEPEYVLADLNGVNGGDDEAVGQSIPASEPDCGPEDEAASQDRHEPMG